MKGIHILTKNVGYESGVVVSLRHLCRILDEEGIPHLMEFYENDEDLLGKVFDGSFSCINIHVPAFRDETLYAMLAAGKNVVVSIHSTLCNLQVEGDSLGRLLRLGSSGCSNLRFSCPSLCEVTGLNAVMKNEYLYLPNTFSLAMDEKMIEQNRKSRSESLEDRVRVSLISAYRPMKNMITQVAAIAMLAKERPVEMCLVDSSLKTPIYHTVLEMAESAGIPVVMIPSMKNEELIRAMGDIHVGMQVSLSETFSYVAMEHMIQGIPMIGSDSVPYASEIASYSDVRTMYKMLKRIVNSPDKYDSYQADARKRAMWAADQNREDALATIIEMMEAAR